jgi:hypothetical protein
LVAEFKFVRLLVDKGVAFSAGLKWFCVIEQQKKSRQECHPEN